jgi:hypothetical protein
MRLVQSRAEGKQKGESNAYVMAAIGDLMRRGCIAFPPILRFQAVSHF